MKVGNKQNGNITYDNVAISTYGPKKHIIKVIAFAFQYCLGISLEAFM